MPMMSSLDAPRNDDVTSDAYRTLTLALAPVAFVMVVFWQTTRSMVEIWLGSQTYQHCLLVMPLFGWLVWRERQHIAGLKIRPWWPGLAGVLALGALWQFGRLAEANVISQFAIIAIAIAVFATTMGLRWARALVFPLGFLFFAVPFGDSLVPVLMEWTADVTVATVRLVGVPVYREGTHFIIPSGSWSVVEACSGIKYLLALFAAGTLYAWISYRSALRRMLFVAAAIAVSISANWLRAFLIVIIGHASDNQWMTGHDHIVFGWILFSAAMVTLFYFSSHWRELAPSAPAHVESPGQRAGTGEAARRVLILVAVALALLPWPMVDAALIRSFDGPKPRLPQVVQTETWRDETDTAVEWKPYLVGPVERSSRSFRRGDRVVGVRLGLFHGQRKGAELASSANSFIESDNLLWKIGAVGKQSAASVGIDRDVRTVMLRGPEGEWLVWQWYWINGVRTASDLRAKYELASARALRRPDSGVWIAVCTRVNDDPAAARGALADFVRDMGPAVDAALARMVHQ